MFILKYDDKLINHHGNSGYGSSRGYLVVRGLIGIQRMGIQEFSRVHKFTVNE